MIIMNNCPFVEIAHKHTHKHKQPRATYVHPVTAAAMKILQKNRSVLHET